MNPNLTSDKNLVQALRKRLPERVDEQEKSFMEFAEYLCSLKPDNIQSMISFYQKSPLPVPVKAFFYRQLFYLSHYFLNHVLWGKSLENFDIFSCLANHFLAPPGHLLNPPSPFLDDEKWTKEIWTHYNRFKDLVNENADINNPNSPIPPTPALSQPDFNISGVMSQLSPSVILYCDEFFSTPEKVDFTDFDFESFFKTQQ